MSITIKRTMIRPKGREEYESRTSMSQIITVASQEIITQATEDTTPSSNRAPSRTDDTTSLPYYAGENITVIGRQISSPNSVQSPNVKNMVLIKKEDFDALTAKSMTTLYLVYVPEFSAFTASVEQVVKAAASGMTLDTSNLTDYFLLTAEEVFNDGSTADVITATTFSMSAMTISANTADTERSIPIPGGITATWSGHSTNFEANVIQEGVPPIPPLSNNEIRYTSTDNQIVTPYYTTSLPAITSNTYYSDRGYGEIVFQGNVTSIGQRAFQMSPTLSSIILPSSCTYIDTQAFYKCTGLSSITIPDGVTTIGAQAFMSAVTLSSITIPDSVERISRGAFSYTLWGDNLPDGPVYTGKVFYKWKGDNTELVNFTINDGTKGIAAYAFSECRSLSSVTIPDSLTVIEEGSFYNCRSLETIDYNGTKAQWGAISIGSSWKYQVPATVVHCTDGDVSI